MRWLAREYRLFLSYPREMRILLLTNLIYALVLPVIDIFVASYVMRNSKDAGLVVTYQLAVYTGIPFTFLINGFLLQHIPIRWLYSAGMLLSGVSMAAMMSSSVITIYGIAIAGILMGMSFGLFWANRDFLALSTTEDTNRNYYYGVETFFYTITYVVVPAAIGWFIESTGTHHWFSGDRNTAYRIVTAIVFLLTITSSAMVQRGRFVNPPRTQFLYLRWHALWWKMLVLAALKGLTQGYFVTAPAMLVMKLVGQEGTLGALVAIGGIVSSLVLYAAGRLSKPAHRLYIFGIGLTVFAFGTGWNAAMFNAAGVIVFMICLTLARPLHDLAYFPIQMRVIEVLSRIEKRNQFAYLFNHEFGLYLGRFFGCGLFIATAAFVSDVFALKYALLFVGVIQLLSLPVARIVVHGAAEAEQAEQRRLDTVAAKGVNQ
jgi:YQGE family putative transporter